jgi:oligopeptide/dipeptide ABC transporter ATP-binding protein
MLITHNLGVVAETCDRIIVMYAGLVVEEGSVFSIFEDPKHPYTVGLIKSIPSLEARDNHTKLESIPGVVPNPLNMPKGCRFSPRCSRVMDKCRTNEPELTIIGEERTVRCHLYNKKDGGK